MTSKTKSRQEGRNAYDAGKTPHCPYEHINEWSVYRSAWYEGYYEARLADKLPRHFTLEPLEEVTR